MTTDKKQKTFLLSIRYNKKKRIFLYLSSIKLKQQQTKKKSEKKLIKISISKLK